MHDRGGGDGGRGAEGTCGGARGEGGCQHAGDRAGPEARAWTGRWPCIGTVRPVSANKKRNGHKVRGLPVWMQCVPTDIFMLTNVILAAFSVICTHRKLM